MKGRDILAVSERWRVASGDGIDDRDGTGGARVGGGSGKGVRESFRYIDLRVGLTALARSFGSDSSGGGECFCVSAGGPWLAVPEASGPEYNFNISISLSMLSSLSDLESMARKLLSPSDPGPADVEGLCLVSDDGHSARTRLRHRR